MSITACKSQTDKDYKSYHFNGAIEWEGTMLNGKRTGDWKLYDSSGNILRLNKYKLDTLYYSEYYKKNKIIITEHLKDEGIKHGETVSYFLNGKTRGIYNFQNNKQLGIQKTYFESGSLKLQYFQDSIEKKDFKQFYTNGTLFAESERPDNGIVHFYDSLGNPTADIEYLNYRIVDTVKVW